MRSFPELSDLARRTPQLLQEFFTRDATAAVMGIGFLLAGFFVRNSTRLGEFKDGLGALCDAIVIAAILKLFVDPILKRELTRETAQDVFHYAFGYLLPEKLKVHVQQLVIETQTVRRNCRLEWHISQKASDKNRVEVLLTVRFTVLNFTSKPIRYQHVVYSWKDNEEDVGCVRALFFEPNGAQNRPYRLYDPNGLTPDQEKLIKGSKVTLAPNAPEDHNGFGALYFAETDRYGIDQFSIREATLDIEVVVTVDDDLDDLDFSVIPDPSSTSVTGVYQMPQRDPHTKSCRLPGGWTKSSWRTRRFCSAGGSARSRASPTPKSSDSQTIAASRNQPDRHRIPHRSTHVRAWENEMTFPHFNKSVKLRCATLGAIVLLAMATTLPAQAVSLQVAAPQDNGPALSLPHKPTQGVDILSDTQGVDFGPYVTQIMRLVRDSWNKSLAESTSPLPGAGGVTLIHIAIHADGTMAGVRLDGSSRDPSLDHIAWKSITQLKSLPPLPVAFTESAFEVRIHFIVPKKQ